MSMYIEKYNVYITNSATKKTRKVLIDANTPQEAHKKAYINTHMFTEDITKITDYSNSVMFTVKDGFLANK